MAVVIVFTLPIISKQWKQHKITPLHFVDNLSETYLIRGRNNYHAQHLKSSNN